MQDNSKNYQDRQDQEALNLKEIVEQFVRALPERSGKIVTQRYGLDDGNQLIDPGRCEPGFVQSEETENGKPVTWDDEGEDDVLYEISFDEESEMTP